MLIVGIAGAVLIGGLATTIVALRSDGAPAPAPTSGVPPRARAQTESKPVSSAVRAQVASAEARRAGQAAYAMGNLKGALAQYQAAVDANPSDPEARNNLGQLLVRENRPADAVPHFDEAVRIDSQKWAYRFNRGRALGLANRWPEAVADYRAAAQIFPDDYVTRFNLGLALLRVKDFPGAVTALEEAVKLAPGEPSFLISLGTAYVGAQQPGRAKGAFEKFLELAPDDAETPRVKALIAALDAAK
jgi:tetratricopeptide (TPR) repeat protein